MEFTPGEYKGNVCSVDSCYGDDRILQPVADQPLRVQQARKHRKIKRRSHRRVTTEQNTVESSEEKVESYLGQITAIDGNVISIALAEKPEAPEGEAPVGEAPSGEKPDGQAPDGNGGAPNGEPGHPWRSAPSGEKPNGQTT